MKKNTLNFPPPTRDWRHSISLTAKMIILTIVVGLIVWLVLDYALTSKLRSIFHSQLTDRLGHYAMEDRLSFDRYVKTFQESVKLLVTQKKFSEYIEGREWKSEDTFSVRYHRKSPEWFPRHSVLRAFVQPRYALLLDSLGRTREVYLSRQETLPLSLLSPTPLLIKKSRNQSFLTSLGSLLFIITSEDYLDSRGSVKGTLLLASPVDDEFLSSSVVTSRKGHFMALLTSDDEPRIMTSSNLEEFPVGTRLSSLQERYLITGKEFFDYGASEIQIRFVSFVSLEEVDLLTASVISRARQERAVLASVFILASVLMMYWITRNVHQITERINDFSQNTLGMKPQELPGGDQLQILKERFQSLTEEVVKARETIKQQAEEQTRLIVNNAFDAIITMDEKGKVKTWNPQAESIFGWKRGEAAGRSISDMILPPQYMREHEKRLKLFLETGEESVFNMQIQITAVHRNGSEFPVELTISPARSGEEYVFIAIIRDITERKKSERKLKNLNLELSQKNKDLEQLIYVTSHDLRTPLVNIFGFSKELNASVNRLISGLQSDRIPDDIKEKTNSIVEKDVIEALKYITKSVTKMNVLLNGLLKLSRLGRIELKIQEVDMNTLMSDVSGIFGFQLKDAGIKLEISQLPPCNGDEEQLNQVFSNLIGNAMKFLDPERPGFIKISGYQKDGKSVYCVEDNGIGIDPEYQERIFEIFHQLEPGKNSGEGLGLAIVLKSVERQNGKIWIDSEPGRGSRFYVSLPG